VHDYNHIIIVYKSLHLVMIYVTVVKIDRELLTGYAIRAK